eukprot:2470843-Pleurochrysis_carterae.AAC.2
MSFSTAWGDRLARAQPASALTGLSEQQRRRRRRDADADAEAGAALDGMTHYHRADGAAGYERYMKPILPCYGGGIVYNCVRKHGFGVMLFMKSSYWALFCTALRFK